MDISVSPIICISGNPDIARILSKRFSGKNVYFALMEEPWIRRPDASNEIIRRNNLLAFIKHDYVILAGCSKETKKLFLAQFPKRYCAKIIIINTVADFKKVEKRLKNYFIHDNSQDKDLISLSELNSLSTDEKISVIEDSDSVGGIIAENFSRAYGYKILKIDKVDKTLLEHIENLLRSWNVSDDEVCREDSKTELFDILRRRLGDLEKLSFKRIVFFTRGIPYGVLPFCSTVAHFFMERDLGLQILCAYRRIKEGRSGFVSALICDPGDIPDTESVTIKKTLLDEGVDVLDLSGQKAQAYNFSHLVERYPFDFLLISSHAGEVNGRRIKSEVISKKSIKHELVYDLYASFVPVPGGDNVLVTELIVPVLIDGIPWADKKRLQAHSTAKYFDLREFIEELKHNDKREVILTTEDRKGIKFSNALQLYKLSWIPVMHVVGEMRYPVIFNNACSSWIEMAGKFIFAGASVYIGTTKDIQTTLACDCGVKFFEFVKQKIPLAEALFKAQHKYADELGYCPYLYWGHPDIALEFSPRLDCSAIQKKRLHSTILGLHKKLEGLNDLDMQKKVREVIKCLMETF